MSKIQADIASQDVLASEWANEHCFPVVRIAGHGCPGGMDIALLADVKLPFDLNDIAGRITNDGSFEATDFEASDWRSNMIWAIWLRNDRAVWQRQYDEWLNG